MEQTTEFLILADGRILVHNITPTMAAILSELNPADELMRGRARAANEALLEARDRGSSPCQSDVV